MLSLISFTLKETVKLRSENKVIPGCKEKLTAAILILPLEYILTFKIEVEVESLSLTVTSFSLSLAVSLVVSS